MDGAGVPEAPVDHDGDLETWKSDVRPSSCAWQWPVDSIAKAEFVKCISQTQLAWGVALSRRLHATPH
jgi:hypothetical protein